MDSELQNKRTYIRSSTEGLKDRTEEIPHQKR